MSPYQQDVIDATLGEYDVQSAKGLAGIGQQAALSGQFLGGGREGVQRAEYQSASDRNRALLQAQMLQQGFGQAQQAAGQAYRTTNGIRSGTNGIRPTTIRNRVSIKQDSQVKYHNYKQQIFRNWVNWAGSNKRKNRHNWVQHKKLIECKLMEPYERMGTYGQGVTGLISGYPGQYQSGVTPNPTPLQTALGTASVLGGIYGTLGW